MPQPESDQGPAAIEPDVTKCRASQIADVTQFASCLVEPPLSCKYGFNPGGLYFCEHPQRERIIARTLAGASRTVQRLGG